MIKLSRGCCGEEELQEVKEAFDYGYFGLAYKTNEFETRIAEYLGTERNVICTNTGTTALHLALDSVGIVPGDEVIMPSFTFVATAQAASQCGAKIVFCDVHPDTFLMNVDDVKKKMTKKTRAIIPVHYAGRTCDMDELLKIHEETGVRIIEDAAHAFGSEYKGRRIGSFGDITCFSFDSIKALTCGDGGAIVTNDNELDDLARKKRLLGIERKSMVEKDWKKRAWIYDVTTQGYRYHMGNINAAIGLAQIKKVDSFIERRREICHLYDSFLMEQSNIELMPDVYDSITPFMYVIKVKNGKRDSLKRYLADNDIETGISYIPCHSFSLYKSKGVSLPVTEQIFREILCLPIHPMIKDSDVEEVCKCIKGFFDNNQKDL